MTLIVSVLSRHWVMQGSDRRLTFGTNPPQYADAANKSVFAAERFAFAFTGRAEVDGASSDQWFQMKLARLLGEGKSPEESFDEVAALLSGHIGALSAADDNRALAFVGVGWSDDSFARREPLIARISNIHSQVGKTLATPASEFSVSIESLGSIPFLVDVAGAGLKMGRHTSFQVDVASKLDESGDPVPIARAVVDAIRREAAENDAVGRGVMLNSLPRAPGPPDGMIAILGALPERDFRTFAYFPESGERIELLAPLVVGSNGAAFADFGAGGANLQFPGMDGPESGQGEVQAGITYTDPAAPPLRSGAVGQAVRALPKLGRNEACWCESGKKYKKCHGS